MRRRGCDPCARTTRPSWRQVLPPAVAVLLAVVVIGEVAWAAFVLAGSEDLEPHEVPAVVAADPVVAESVARQYNGLPGAPFDLRAVADEDAAHSALADGSARAALVVALDGTKDRLLLASGNDDTLDDAIRQRVEHAEQRIGRGVTVDVVGPTDADERREAARLAVALAMVVGFLIAVGTSLRAGPVAPGLRQGLRRMLAIGALSLLCGGVIGALALHGDAWAVVLARVDPHLVGEPWAGIASLGLPGAGLEVATELSLRGGLPTSPVAVILVWLATAPLVIVLARVVRRHREVPAPDHDHGGHHIGGVRGWRVLGVVAPPHRGDARAHRRRTARRGRRSTTTGLAGRNRRLRALRERDLRRRPQPDRRDARNRRVPRRRRRSRCPAAGRPPGLALR